MRSAPGPLGSRNFRLLLACDVISIAGTGIAVVAVPFAVLSIGGTGTDVGYVATAALLPMIAFLLLGGVLADRMPRHQVIVGAELAQGAAQALSAALVLTGTARVWELLLLAALRGAGRVIRELREGWREFVSRRWLWSIVLQFAGVAAVTTATVSVLGPVVAHESLGGARSWGVIMAAYGAGGVAGGIALIRFRPARMLLAATVGMLVFTVLLFALAVPLAAVAAFVAGASGGVFGVNWNTTMQQEIPPTALSRVSSYDALGSFALTLVGTMVAGPLLAAFGARSVLAAGGVLVLLLTCAVLLIPEVRQLRRVAFAPQEVP